VRCIERKGAASFLGDQLVRLLIPLLLYDLLLDPLVVYIAGGRHGSYWSFYGPYLLQVRTIGPGPAWFLAALLLFTLGYAAWRGLSRKRSPAVHRPGTLPSSRAIFGFIVALGLVSFVVRIWWPLSRVFEPFNLPVGYLPLYLSLFILGLVASRRHWFAELSARMGRDWSLMALIATALLICGGLAISFKMGGTGGAGTQIDSYMGGFHWQAFIDAVWEAFLVVGVCLGLLVLFRQRWNRQGRLAKGLAASAFTVYLIHPLVIVSVASAFSTVALSPLLKFGIAVLLVLPLCFLVALVLRKLPLVKRML
jgi:glucans biosynthesis protein C